MKRSIRILTLAVLCGLAVGCEGAVNPGKKTNEGLNTLYFMLDGEVISSGGRAPNWVRSLFGIFNPNPDKSDTPPRSVFAGFTEAGDVFWIDASLTLNEWDATPLYIQFPARMMKQGATIDYPHLQAKMPYISGYERDMSFPQGYAFTPIRRSADFLDGSLHIRSWDPETGILSGEFKFKVRMISEGIANDTFHASSKNNQHPDEYEVRPRMTMELAITRGTFDVSYEE